MIQFHQLNCNSCGAGLSRTSGLCDCLYCGNTNLITGKKTEIVYVESRPKIRGLSKKQQALIWAGAALFPIVLMRHFYGGRYRYKAPKTIVRLANGEIIEI